MGEVIELYQIKRRVAEYPTSLLHPTTTRDRIVEAAWLAIGIPMSLGILALQLWPFVARYFF